MKDIFKSMLLLGMFAFIGTGLLIWIAAATKQRIADNERITLLEQLNEIVPQDQYNNDLVNDVIEIPATPMLGGKKPLIVYRARRDGSAVAAILTVIAPDGYSGAIHLLVGIYANGELAGVRAIKHKETPGLGDKVDAKRSDWILGFTGKSLNHPQSGLWSVKKDGGVFDSFTGATITPRAVVKAVHKTLIFFAQDKQNLFTTEPTIAKAGE